MATSKTPGASAMAPWIYLANQNQPLDPYAIWALLTEFRAFMLDHDLPAVVNFVVELETPYDPQIHFLGLLNKAPRTTKAPMGKPPNGLPSQFAGGLTLDVPAAYLDSGLGKPAPTFITLRLSRNGANQDELADAVRALVNTPYVKRLQIGQPRAVKNPDHNLAPKPPRLSPRRPVPVVLGILEDSCPFAHAALRQGGPTAMKTRLVALWDQTNDRKPRMPWAASHQFAYGGQLLKPAMDALLTRHHDGQSVDEDTLYADPDVAMSHLALRASHGATVLPLMATPWRTSMHRLGQDDEDTDQETPEAAGPADAAPIVAVQLPLEQVKVSSGRWMAVNALDGLHYIVDAARRLGEPTQPPPLVVNLSYGGMAGPHDGTGMLESAIDEMTGLYGADMAVVLAAGNAHGTQRDAEQDEQYAPGGAHARQVLPPGGTAELTLFVPPDKQFETYLEIWFDVERADPSKDRFLEDKEVQITVTPPDEPSWSPLDCPGIEVWPLTAAAKRKQAGLFFLKRVSQGHHRSMALLVVAATQVSSQYVSAPAGRWTIKVESLSKMDGGQKGRNLVLDAWVERDDTVVGAHRGQSARLVHLGPGPSPLTDANTFSNIATGKQTFKVGALCSRGPGANKVVSAYSAAGATVRLGPDFSAVADAGKALAGIRVSGSQSGMFVRANGTSLAAPQAARWLADQLAAGVPLNRLRPRARVGARRGQPI